MSDNNIINSLKRLERAGTEHSRATKKLFAAAREVAIFIENIAPIGVQLPQGYVVRKINSNIGSEKFLVRDETDYIDGIGGYLHNDFSCWIPLPTRIAVLNFANDVSAGLLNEIADFLVQRTLEDDTATATLQKQLKAVADCQK
ncbi:MAG: hypothetical protein C4542_00470 [Dehalococcoidia bacterium]|nr:MAG: hypothetical protein C4542_00470 [Dehalococcoidia bacterium]